jgi:hypothetical protein
MLERWLLLSAVAATVISLGMELVSWQRSRTGHRKFIVSALLGVLTLLILAVLLVEASGKA